MTTELPRGFSAHVANIGIKDATDDFVVIAAERRVPAAGVFTRSRFAGPSVVISREHVADGWARAIVVVSSSGMLFGSHSMRRSIAGSTSVFDASYCFVQRPICRAK